MHIMDIVVKRFLFLCKYVFLTLVLSQILQPAETQDSVDLNPTVLQTVHLYCYLSRFLMETPCPPTEFYIIILEKPPPYYTPRSHFPSLSRTVR